MTQPPTPPPRLTGVGRSRRTSTEPAAGGGVRRRRSADLAIGRVHRGGRRATRGDRRRRRVTSLSGASRDGDRQPTSLLVLRSTVTTTLGEERVTPLLVNRLRWALCMKRYLALSLLSIALVGCSQSSSASHGATSKPPAAGSGATSIPIPPNQDVTTRVSLPTGTRSVRFKDGSGAFKCHSVTMSRADGSISNVFTDSDMPAKASMSQGSAPGGSYATVNVQCHGGETSSELIVTPGS